MCVVLDRGIRAGYTERSAAGSVPDTSASGVGGEVPRREPWWGRARRARRVLARESERLVGAMALYTGDPELARDVAQEALVRACARWGRVSRLDTRPGAWVHRVALNLAKNEARRRGRERVAIHRLQGRAEEVIADPAEGAPVRAALAELAPRQRAALVLRYWSQLSVRETATAMRCREGTVKALTHQAIARLRDVLATEEGHDGH